MVVKHDALCWVQKRAYLYVLTWWSMGNIVWTGRLDSMHD